MNDDELRDHLWSTLEPVSSPTPELARLRRIARRRRRRQQGTAAALGLLLLAGAGVGIAEATSGNPGRSEVTALTPSPDPADVTIPCTSAQVALQVGQTLHVAPCPDDGAHTVGAVPVMGTAIARIGRETFQAEERGASTLQIEYTGCAGPRGTPCTADQRLIGTIVVTVGPTYVKDSPPEPVACKGGRVSVRVGQQLDLTDCPVGLQSSIDDPSVIASAGAPNVFAAIKPGTTNVELFVKPQCSPGMMCPQYVRDLGTLVVTVTPSG